MSEHFFPNRPAEVRRYPKGVKSEQRLNGVRIYRSSPETVVLQIRTGGSNFATVHLPFDIAKQVANALAEEAGGYSLSDLDKLREKFP